MAWARIDDGWWCHPKVIGLSLAATGLWARALSWSCHQRRPTIPAGLVKMLAGDEAQVLAKELEQAGLWQPHPDGWEVHDWSEYQGRTLSEVRSEAGRKGGKASGQSRATKPQASDEASRQQTEQPEPNDEGPEQPNMDPFAGVFDTDDPPDEAPASKQPASKRRSKPPASDEAGTRPVPSQPEVQVQTHPLDGDRDVSWTDELDASFELFWQAFPRGRAGKPGGDGPKKPARLRWGRMTVAEREAALEAVDHYREHVESPDGPIAAHAITWLNQERWEQWAEPAAIGPADRDCPECGRPLGWSGHPECGVKVEHD